MLHANYDLVSVVKSLDVYNNPRYKMD